MNQTPASEPVRKKRFVPGAFLIRAIVVISLAHVYVGWSLIPDLPDSSSMKLLPVVLLCLSVMVIPTRVFLRTWTDNHDLIDKFSWASSLFMGWFSSLFVFTLLGDLIFLLPQTEAWRAEGSLAVVALSLLVTIIGYWNARKVARVVNQTVPLEGLPAALDGFTIVQITDLHVGPTIKRKYVKGVVDRVNGLNADMVAVTGDVVDGPVDHLSDDTAPLGDLRARHGVYIVTGNHEYYAGADNWIAEFQRLGLKTLLDEHVVLEHDGEQLVVAGVNDYSAPRVHDHHDSDPTAALAGSPPGLQKILLAHQPRSARAAEQAGVNLQISGHTHGGQFWPWNHFVRIQQPYTAGLHRHGDMWVYTSRGTGYWGPPKRFGAPSEITLIRLESA